jgi:hypothetical protein
MASTQQRVGKVSTKEKELCWRSQLTQVLESLSAYAQEDPEIAYDLNSILDQAKQKLVGVNNHGGYAM